MYSDAFYKEIYKAAQIDFKRNFIFDSVFSLMPRLHVFFGFSRSLADWNWIHLKSKLCFKYITRTNLLFKLMSRIVCTNQFYLRNNDDDCDDEAEENCNLHIDLYPHILTHTQTRIECCVHFTSNEIKSK